MAVLTMQNRELFYQPFREFTEQQERMQLQFSRKAVSK